MRTAFIVVTSVCNKSCKYCFYAQQNERYVADRLTEDTLAATVAGLSSRGFTDVIITGGEPLLRRELVLASLRAITGLGMLGWLSTNAKMISPRLASDLIDAGVKGIHISVDTIGADIVRVTSPQEFAHVMRTVDVLKSLGLPWLCLTCVIGAHNKDAVAPLYGLATEKKVDLMLQPVFVTGPGAGTSSLTPGDWRDLAPFLRSWGQATDRKNYVNVLLDFYLRGVRPAACGMGKDVVVVDSDGAVYPCFHRRDLRAGNVLDDDLDAVMTNLDQYFIAETSQAGCFGEHCVSLFS